MWPNWKKERETNERRAQDMTLLEVVEFTKDLDLRAGGLSILIDKLVSEIHYIKDEVEWLKRNGYRGQ